MSDNMCGAPNEDWRHKRRKKLGPFFCDFHLYANPTYKQPLEKMVRSIRRMVLGLLHLCGV